MISCIELSLIRLDEKMNEGYVYRSNDGKDKKNEIFSRDYININLKNERYSLISMIDINNLLKRLN